MKLTLGYRITSNLDLERNRRGFEETGQVLGRGIESNRETVLVTMALGERSESFVLTTWSLLCL